VHGSRRLLLLLPVLLSAACGDLSYLRDTAPQTDRPLTPRETRHATNAWRKANFGPTADGFQITTNRTPPPLTKLIDAYEIRTRLPEQPGAVGIPVLIDTAPAPGVTVPITPHAHLLTLQPRTLVGSQTGRNQIQLDFHEPRGSATLNGHPLAYTPGLTFDYIAREQWQGFLNLRGLFAPADYANRRGFYLATPYDPDKIPLIFIHGLASTPSTFRDMFVQLQRDPDLWNRYQFWFYLYPTGDPWLATAANFRRDLAELIEAVDPQRDDHNLHNMVLIGHSMGGLISRASISHNSKALYDAYFQRDLARLELTPAEEASLRSTLLYEPIPWPKRVIFLSTPHQGSKLATGPLQWIARSLISIPGRLIGGTYHTLEHLVRHDPDVLTDDAQLFYQDGESSVTQLDASNPALSALQNMPMREDVQLHSIIGDLGGDSWSVETDGVVPYESAHLPQADSELVIQSSHGTGNSRRAAAEVTRILRLHR
jgi:pimeloyl-ACP methyl ester carboxylesterase